MIATQLRRAGHGQLDRAFVDDMPATRRRLRIAGYRAETRCRTFLHHGHVPHADRRTFPRRKHDVADLARIRHEAAKREGMRTKKSALAIVRAWLAEAKKDKDTQKARKLVQAEKYLRSRNRNKRKS